MDKHVKIAHIKDKYKCDKCDYVCAASSSFYIHMKKDHIMCTVCQFVTTSDKMFKRHMISWHSTQNLQAKSNDDISNYQKGDKEIPLKIESVNQKKEIQEPFQGSKASLAEPGANETDIADICKEKSLSNKVVGVNKDDEYWTLKDEANEEKEDGFWTFEEISFSCLQCDFIGSSESDIRHHKYTHDKENGGIRCEKCPFISKSKGGLTNHMVKIHFQEPNTVQRAKKGEKVEYNCSDCDFIAAGTRQMTKHALDIHKTVLRINKNPRDNRKLDAVPLAKDKICKYCPYATAYMYNLRKHERAVH